MIISIRHKMDTFDDMTDFDAFDGFDDFDDFDDYDDFDDFDDYGIQDNDNTSNERIDTMSFNDDLELGRKAEMLWRRYKGRLGSNVIPMFTKHNTTERVEGSDFTVTGLRTEDLAHQDNLRLGMGHEEVKASLSGGLFMSNSVDLTLGLELFSNNIQYKDGQLVHNPRNKWTPGWLHSLLSPDEKNAENEALGRTERAVTPHSLTFLYYWKPTDESEPTPYACVHFPDWNALRKRILELAKVYLPDCSLVPWDVDPESTEWNDCPYVRGAYWNIPFSQLTGLYKVTIINALPDLTRLLKRPSKLNYDQLIQLMLYADRNFLNTKEEDERLDRIDKRARTKVVGHFN